MAKKRKNFLPKKIAGVKVPKAVRKGRFGELLASPRGQAILAEAIVAAGAVAGAKKAADNPQARQALRDAADKVQQTGDGASQKMGDATSVLAFALGEAARSFADAVRRHDSGRQDEASGHGPADDHVGDDDSKKNSSYEAGPL